MVSRRTYAVCGPAVVAAVVFITVVSEALLPLVEVVEGGRCHYVVIGRDVREVDRCLGLRDGLQTMLALRARTRPDDDRRGNERATACLVVSDR